MLAIPDCSKTYILPNLSYIQPQQQNYYIVQIKITIADHK